MYTVLLLFISFRVLITKRKTIEKMSKSVEESPKKKKYLKILKKSEGSPDNASGKSPKKGKKSAKHDATEVVEDVQIQLKDADDTIAPRTHQQKGKPRQQKYVLFIGNLPFDVEETEVMEHFKALKPKISSFRLLTDPKTGLSRGCGFLELTDKNAYDTSLKLNKSKLRDRNIRVQYTVPGSAKNVQRRKFIQQKGKKMLGQKKSKKEKIKN